jgi:hypothetical protein
MFWYVLAFLKFDNKNGVRIFVLGKFIIYETLKFELNSLLHNIFKLGAALVNKGWLRIRLHNQLQDGTFMIWKTWKNLKYFGDYFNELQSLQLIFFFNSPNLQACQHVLHVMWSKNYMMSFILTPKDLWVFGCKTTQNYPFWKNDL